MYSKQEQKYRLSLSLSPESEISWRNLAEIFGIEIKLLWGGMV